MGGCSHGRRSERVESDGSEGWKVAASRKMMRRGRNQMLAKDAEVKRKIEERTKEIQEELR